MNFSYSSSLKSEKRSAINDHDYIMPASSTPKKQKVDTIELLYKETLGELQSINSSLKDLTNSARGIEMGVNRIAEALELMAERSN